MATVGISIRMDEDVLKRIDEVAEFCDQSRSELINRVMRNNIDEEYQFQKKLMDPIFQKIAKLVVKPGFALTLAKLAGEELSPELLEQAGKAIEKAEARSRSRKEQRAEGQRNALA